MGMRAGGTPRPGNAGALVASRTAYIAATLGAAGSYTVPQVDGSGVFPWNFESEKSDITHAAGSSIFTIVQAGLYHIGAYFTVQAVLPITDQSIVASLITPDSNPAIQQYVSAFRIQDVAGAWNIDEAVATVGGAQFVRFVAGDRFRFSVTGPVSTGGIAVNVDAGPNGEGPNAWMFAYRVY